MWLSPCIDGLMGSRGVGEGVLYGPMTRVLRRQNLVMEYSPSEGVQGCIL